MSNTFDRREFARRAVISSIAVGSATAASAEQEEKPEEPETLETETETPSKPEDLLLDIIRQQYPSEQLTPEVLNQIKRDIIGHRSRSGVLKAVSLTNGEAPFVFQAYRAADEAEPGTIQIRPRKTQEDTKSD